MLKFVPTPEYLSLSEHAKALQEENDCAVRAVTVVTGAHYVDVHSLFEKHGRKRRDGVYMCTTEKVLRDLGFSSREWTSAQKIAMIHSYPDYVVKSITLRQMMLFPDLWSRQGTLLVRSHRHLSAFRDGKLHDHMDGLKSHVKQIFSINPIKET